MATIWHYSKRNADAIAEGRLDGSPWWREEFDGTREEAEQAVLSLYGRAGRVLRSGDRVLFQYVGFSLTVE